MPMIPITLHEHKVWGYVDSGATLSISITSPLRLGTGKSALPLVAGPAPTDCTVVHSAPQHTRGKECKRYDDHHHRPPARDLQTA